MFVSQFGVGSAQSKLERQTTQILLAVSHMTVGDVTHCVESEQPHVSLGERHTGVVPEQVTVLSKPV